MKILFSAILSIIASFVFSQNTITLTSAIKTDSQSVCSNSAIVNIAYAITGATGATVTNLPQGIISSFANNTLTIKGWSSYNGVYNYKVKLTGGDGTGNASGIIEIIQTPSINLVANQTVCEGTNFNQINFSGSSNTQFNWTNSNPSIGLAASGTGNIPSFTGTSFGGSVINAIIIVTPSIEKCIGTTKSFILRVNPKDDASFSYSDISFCTSQNNPTPTINGTIGGYFSATPVGLNINPTTGFIDLAKSTFGTYFVKYSTPGTCMSDSTVKISLGNNPSVNNISDQIICNGDSLTAIQFTGNLGTVFSWTNSNSGIGFPTSGTGNIPSIKCKNATNNLLSSTFSVTPIIGNCVGTPISFNISIKNNLLPSVSLLANKYSINDTLSICMDDLITFSTIMKDTISPSFQWYKNNSMLNGSTKPTFNTANLKNNDRISLRITNNDQCGISVFSKELIVKIQQVNFTTTVNNLTNCELDNGEILVKGISIGKLSLYSMNNLLLRDTLIPLNLNIPYVFSPLSAGIYKVKFESNSCSSIKTVNLVGPVAPDEIIISNINQPNCTKKTGSIEFSTQIFDNLYLTSNTGLNIPFNELKVNNNNNYILDSLTPGNYTFYVKDIIYGCSSIGVDVQIDSVKNSKTPSLSLLANKNILNDTLSICNDDIITFSANLKDTMAPSYQWYQNNVALTGETKPTFTTSSLQDKDHISLEITNNYQCVTPIFSKELIVNKVEIYAPLILGINQPYCSKEVGSIKFYISTTEKSLSIESNNISTPIANLKYDTNSYSYTLDSLLPGNYVFYVKNESGCKSKGSTVVNINLPPVKTTPGTIDSIPPLAVNDSLTLQQHGDKGGKWGTYDPSILKIDAKTGKITALSPGKATVFYVVVGQCDTITFLTANVIPSKTTGINNILEKEIKIFPNPTKDKIHLQNVQGCTISLFSVNGIEVFKQQIQQQNFELDLNGSLGKGIYFINVRDDKSDNSFTKKIILE